MDYANSVQVLFTEDETAENEKGIEVPMVFVDTTFNLSDDNSFTVTGMGSDMDAAKVDLIREVNSVIAALSNFRLDAVKLSIPEMAEKFTGTENLLDEDSDTE